MSDKVDILFNFIDYLYRLNETNAIDALTTLYSEIVVPSLTSEICVQEVCSYRPVPSTKVEHLKILYFILGITGSTEKE